MWRHDSTFVQPVDVFWSYRVTVSARTTAGLLLFAHILLARLQPLLERISDQYHISRVLHVKDATIDAILALRLLSEIHREFNRPLHWAYVDKRQHLILLIAWHCGKH